jgi:hypothetical protein
MSRRTVIAVFTNVIVAAGCATDKPSSSVTMAPSMAPPSSLAVATVPPAVPPLVDVEPIALQMVDAPGFAVDVMTVRLRDALIRTSGATVVDAASVRAEIAACHEAPCPDEQQTRFRSARYVAVATMSRVGSFVLGTATVTVGGVELGRATARDDEAGMVADALGWALGHRFRTAVTARAIGTADVPATAER